MAYALVRAFNMDEELLMRRNMGDQHQMQHMNGQHGDALQVANHVALKSTDSIMNGNSMDISKDDLETIVHHATVHQEHSKVDDGMNKVY